MGEWLCRSLRSTDRTLEADRVSGSVVVNLEAYATRDEVRAYELRSIEGVFAADTARELCLL